MKNNDEFVEVEKKEEEKVVDFGETSDKDVEDEKIIELEDILEKGEKEASEIPEAEPRERILVEDELLHEDLSKVLETPEEQLSSEDAIVSSMPEPPIGISEERIEALITKVVQDVVERVVRETMATTSEKVIREAIEALKRSIESTSD